MNLFLEWRPRVPWNMSLLCPFSELDFSTAETFVQVHIIPRSTRESSLKPNLLLLRIWHRFTPRMTVTVCRPILNVNRLVKQRHQACPRVRVSLFHCTSAHSLARVTIRWVEHNRDFLHSHSSALKFHFHRSEYLCLLMSSPSEQSKAINYVNKHLLPFFASHLAKLKRLMGCLIFLPKECMQKLPYEDLMLDLIHRELENMFATEFSVSLEMSVRRSIVPGLDKHDYNTFPCCVSHDSR